MMAVTILLLLLPTASYALAKNDTAQAGQNESQNTPADGGSMIVGGSILAVGCVAALIILVRFARSRRSRLNSLVSKKELPDTKDQIMRSKTLFVITDSRQPSSNHVLSTEKPISGATIKTVEDPVGAVPSDADMPHRHYRVHLTTCVDRPPTDIQLLDLDDYEISDLSLQAFPSKSAIHLAEDRLVAPQLSEGMNHSSGSRLQSFLATGREESILMNELELSDLE